MLKILTLHTNGDLNVHVATKEASSNAMESKAVEVEGVEGLKVTEDVVMDVIHVEDFVPKNKENVMLNINGKNRSIYGHGH